MQARIFYDDPGYLPAKILPAPLAKVGQSVHKGKATLGCLMAFEYAEPLTEDHGGFLRGLMWGPGGRSEEHPEELLFQGRFLVILSFPHAEPQAAWFKEREEKALAKLALSEVLKLAYAAVEQRDAKSGLQLLTDNAALVADHAFAQYLLGEFAAELRESRTAEKAYRRAIELHDSGQNLLPEAPATLWAAVDGLALGLLRLQQFDQAVAPLERGVTLARELGEKDLTSRSLYNLACGLARVERFDASLAALQESIALGPEYKAMAATDADFTDARERPEFKELLGI